MFRHHAHDKPMTETERETLLRQGAVIQGLVMHNEPSAADPHIYQPAPGSPEAQRLAEVRGAQQLRHADRIPKLQLPLSAGGPSSPSRPRPDGRCMTWPSCMRPVTSGNQRRARRRN